MKIYILGIGGTLMSGVAVLAKQLGHEVRGCDTKLYPPMSRQLTKVDIDYDLDYLPQHLDWAPDLILVGNTVTANSPIFTAIQQRKLAFSSAPEWLHANALAHKRVIAISGTHGKTTTTAILVKLIQSLGVDCGYLIAGAAQGLQYSANIGSSPWFIIEADEYDTACFDKVPKFMHYNPDILLINNLEFDHADIYKDYNSVEHVFIELLNSLQETAITIMPDAKFVLAKVRGSSKFYKSCDWCVQAISADAASFRVFYKEKELGEVSWSLLGEHNLDNLRAALCVLSSTDIDFEHKDKVILSTLSGFGGAARRLQDLGEHNGIRIIDDFAHHPTAIANTTQAVKNKFPTRRLVACVSFSNYSMRHGVHTRSLPAAFAKADKIVLLDNTKLKFPLSDLEAKLPEKSCIIAEEDSQALLNILQPGDVLLFMGSRDLEVLRQALLD